MEDIQETKFQLLRTEITTLAWLLRWNYGYFEDIGGKDRSIKFLYTIQFLNKYACTIYSDFSRTMVSLLQHR